MADSVDIQDYLFAQETQPEEGAHVRVRPEPVRPKTYGQGLPLKGPKLNGVVFEWSGAYVVDSNCPNGIGDAKAGKVHPNTIAQSPELWMSERNYQDYTISKKEQNDE